MAPENDSNPSRTLKTIEETFTNVIPTIGIDELGAPVMQIVDGSGKVHAMYGYEDLAGLGDNEKFVDLIDQFMRQRDEFIWDTHTNVEEEDLLDQLDVPDNNQDQSVEEEQSMQFVDEAPRDVIKETVVERITVVKEVDSSNSGDTLKIVLGALLTLVVAVTSIGAVCCMCRRRS